MALELAYAGADVCINFVGDATPARELQQKIQALGRRAIIIEADVSDRTAIDQMFDMAEQQLGQVGSGLLLL